MNSLLVVLGLTIALAATIYVTTRRPTTAVIASVLLADGIFHLFAYSWANPREQPKMLMWMPVSLLFLGFVSMLASAFAVIVLNRILVPKRPPPDGLPRCKKCGYILLTTLQPRCPECGEFFEPPQRENGS